MGQNGKVMPNLDQRTTKLLNLTVLQRVDPFVEEILMTAGHVTFYEFNIDLGQWSRKDVEGSFFVVKRNAQPRFQFVVMNRRSTDNLVENLLGDFEFEVQVPYLLYRNAAQEVNGIWFYNSKECEEVANLFSRILSAYSKVPQKPIVVPSKSEFHELEAVPTMAVMDGPLEPPASSSTDLPDDPAFINFFNAALTTGNSTNVAATSKVNQIVTPEPSPAQPNNPWAFLQSLQSSTASSHTSVPLDSVENVSHSQTTSVRHPLAFLTSSSTIVGQSASPSIPSAPPMNPPSTNLPNPFGGTPLLQPFPPPSPPPFAPSPSSLTAYRGPVINRDKVKEALTFLIQDNQFIDMVYRALLNSHQ